MGHTVHWQGATRYGNVYAIDTGAIFGQMGVKEKGGLTMAELACRTSVLTTQKPTNSLVEMRLIDAEHEPMKPFGQYAQKT